MEPPLATPGPYYPDHAHEDMLSFPFAEELRVVRQLKARYQRGFALFLELYSTRSYAKAIPLLPTDADAATIARYSQALVQGEQSSYENDYG